MIKRTRRVRRNTVKRRNKRQNTVRRRNKRHNFRRVTRKKVIRRRRKSGIRKRTVHKRRNNRTNTRLVGGDGQSGGREFQCSNLGLKEAKKLVYACSNLGDKRFPVNDLNEIAEIHNIRYKEHEYSPESSNKIKCGCKRPSILGYTLCKCSNKDNTNLEELRNYDYVNNTDNRDFEIGDVIKIKAPFKYIKYGNMTENDFDRYFSFMYDIESKEIKDSEEINNKKNVIKSLFNLQNRLVSNNPYYIIVGKKEDGKDDYVDLIFRDKDIDVRSLSKKLINSQITELRKDNFHKYSPVEKKNINLEINMINNEWKGYITLRRGITSEKRLVIRVNNFSYFKRFFELSKIDSELDDNGVTLLKTKGSIEKIEEDIEKNDVKDRILNNTWWFTFHGSHETRNGYHILQPNQYVIMNCEPNTLSYIAYDNLDKKIDDKSLLTFLRKIRNDINKNKIRHKKWCIFTKQVPNLNLTLDNGKNKRSGIFKFPYEFYQDSEILRTEKYLDNIYLRLNDDEQVTARELDYNDPNSVYPNLNKYIEVGEKKKRYTFTQILEQMNIIYEPFIILLTACREMNWGEKETLITETKRKTYNLPPVLKKMSAIVRNKGSRNKGKVNRI